MHDPPTCRVRRLRGALAVFLDRLRLVGPGGPCLGVRVLALVSDAAERRRIERLVRRAVRDLADTVGRPFPADAVLVQATAAPALAPVDPCVRMRDGRTLIRLVLTRDGRQLTADELLAQLGQHVVALAADRHASPSTSSGPPGTTARPASAALPPDPVLPAAAPNGRAA